jgi:hypothetical protein
MSDFNHSKKDKKLSNSDNPETILSASIDFSEAMMDFLFERQLLDIPYKRTMDKMERSLFDEDAFQYLLSLVQNDSIDEIMFERLVGLCLSLEMLIPDKIDIDKMGQIVEILSAGGMNMNIAKDVADILLGRIEVDYQSNIN